MINNLENWLVWIIGILMIAFFARLALKAKEKEKASCILLFCFFTIIAILLISISSYAFGTGYPTNSLSQDTEGGLPPENEIFVVKAIAEVGEPNEQDIFLLVVPFVDITREPFYYKITKENLIEPITVNDRIVRDDQLIRKIT